MGEHHQHDLHGRRLWLAVAVNLILTVAQVVGGVLSGSLALIADALHNLSDAISLVLALVARRIGQKPADEVMTFGYGRAEIIAALINFTTLILLGGYLIGEAISRVITPQPITGWIVVSVAAIALIIDLITAALTYSLSKESMNVRAAFLHNLADALGSLGVIVAGTLVILYDWRLADAIITFVIAAYVMYHGFSEIGSAIRILMSGTPAGLNVQQTIEAMEAIDGVLSVHHLHLWAIDEHRTSLEAHIVTEQLSGPDAEQVKSRVKNTLEQQFNITHSTLELEYPLDTSCHDH